MQIVDVEYFHDGIRLVGQIAVDDGRIGRRPGVLVSHDAGGLSDHAKRSARRLAELGYVAFALDYYGGGVRLPPEEVGVRYSELGSDPLRVRSIATAGLAVLMANEYADPNHVAAIGYCFGGTMSLELGRGGADLQAVVGFHSGLATTRPQDAANITGKVLVCIGAEDPIVPPDQRLAFEEEMRNGGVDWQLHLYGGVGHSFTNPEADGSNPGMKYDQRSDERSWQAMLGLFNEVFSPRHDCPMTAPSIRSFDVAALYLALDDQRTELGLSWRGVADQIWAMSSDLNNRRRDHPISPSTLTGMAKKPRTSCQHALFMLRWLGRTPESFLPNSDTDDGRFALPEAGADRRLRWSLKLLYATMDEKRREEGLTWPELAGVLGCSPNQLTSLRTAKFATGMDLAMRIVQWLGRPAADFVYPATW